MPGAASNLKCSRRGGLALAVSFALIGMIVLAAAVPTVAQQDATGACVNEPPVALTDRNKLAGKDVRALLARRGSLSMLGRAGDKGEFEVRFTYTFREDGSYGQICETRRAGNPLWAACAYIVVGGKRSPGDRTNGIYRIDEIGTLCVADSRDSGEQCGTLHTHSGRYFRKIVGRVARCMATEVYFQDKPAIRTQYDKVDLPRLRETAYQSVMARVASEKILRADNPRDIGQETQYRGRPQNKAVVGCVAWSRSTPVSVRFVAWTLHWGFRSESEARYRTMQRCEQHPLHKDHSCRCTFIDVNDRNVLEFPTTFIDEHFK